MGSPDQGAKMIPPEIIAEMEHEADGLTHGLVRLEIIIHDKQLRFKLTREISIVPGKSAAGSIPEDTK
jgi:hypothetical protein